MLHRPWSITALSIFLGLLGPLWAVYWTYQNFSEISTAWKNINPFIVSICILSFVVAHGIWKVRTWGYFSYLFLACLSLSYLMYEYMVNTDPENYLFLLCAAAFATGTCILLQRHVSAPYFNPRLRWWERDPRYRVQVSAKFHIDRQTRQGNLLDISRGGCFAELEAKLIVGEEIEMRMQMLKFDFTTRAKVIWNSHDPKGYGLMFIGMTRRHRKEIDRILAYLVDSQGERGPLINQGIRPA